VIELDAATFCLQWATGGLLFLWVTTRRREVGIGYGWLMRATFGLIAAIGVVAGFRYGDDLGRELAGIGVVLATSAALGVSIVRRRAGVAGERERVAVRSARITAMTGIDRDIDGPRDDVPEFPPVLDLIAPAIGIIGLIFAAGAATQGDASYIVSLVRVLAGAAFLGAVTDAMLLGHWYLVQPGLARGPLLELVRWTGITWPAEVVAMLLPTGMVSVLDGSIDDGYGGMLGWFWIACAVGTIALVVVTRAALKERYYSAVMAATGLLYLAILTAFGTDLVARAILA
jgi:FtsH-binding integral membrane protein